MPVVVNLGGGRGRKTLGHSKTFGTKSFGESDHKIMVIVVLQ